MERAAASTPGTARVKPPVAAVGGSVALALPSRRSQARTAPKLPSCGYCS